MSEQNQASPGPVEFGRLSPWRDSTGLDDRRAREHGARLELRAAAESEIATREEYVGLLGVAPGERVLDVGCGSGAVTRTLARRVAPGGRAVGMDTSAALLAVAREHANEAGLGATIEFKVGDCRALPFPDASFDAAVAATTLSHVPDPARALAEMVRVTRPGGRVGVFDVDGDLTLFAHPDRELTRKIVAAFSDQGWVNGWLMRELPARCAALGIENVRIRAFMPLESGGYYANRAERSAEVAEQTGVISGEEKTRWLQVLRTDIAGKRFLGGQVHLFVWGVRPRS
jgi:ubiquinone/menaquinone biosynthesis C-methylase UbiE